ncbi:hypothetical protein GCM10009654_34470 [Streptomyces hebeiensis]|uniref:Uncharacterized protein n=1 Tax=Streptomyces hebeiensis TaxID=229486 RepID=A0ABN1UWN7_9ACTN
MASKPADAAAASAPASAPASGEEGVASLMLHTIGPRRRDPVAGIPAGRLVSARARRLLTWSDDRPDTRVPGPQVEAPISHLAVPVGQRVTGQAAAIVPYGRWRSPDAPRGSTRRCSGF